jgi:hypothetical protein
MGFCWQNAIKIGFFISLLWLAEWFLVSPAEAFFTASKVSLTGISLGTTSNWSEDETPPVSEVASLALYQNQKEFLVNYSFSDEASGVDQVEIFYRYNHEPDWHSWVVKSGSTLTGSFVFDSLPGDGFYELMSLATDKAGNIEEKLLADTSTTVDTLPPLTNLLVDLPVIIKNERIFNGGFEDGLNGWVSEGAVTVATGTAKLTGEVSSIKQSVDLEGLDKAYLSFTYRLSTSDSASRGYFQTLIDNQEVVHDGWDNPGLTVLDLDWKKILYPLGDYLGQKIDLEFRLIQPELGYETAALVDEVKICAATPQVTTDTPISLVSNDASGSANQTIYYQLNNSVPVVYSTTPILLPTPGVYQLTYYAVDEAGNSEATQSAVLASQEKIDWGVVLNEIAPNESLVGLFNNSAVPVSLNGWRIKTALGSGETIIGTIQAGASLRVDTTGLLTINSQKETIYLYDNANNLVDSYRYDLATALPGGKSLRREPVGIGSWRDPLIEPEVEFYWVDENQVGFVLHNLENYQKVDYEITYQTNDLEEGIRGNLDLNGEKEIRRENFVLGSCSTGGTCVYRQKVKNLHLKVRLSGQDEKEISRDLH